jgi:hypothetical protein
MAVVAQLRSSPTTRPTRWPGAAVAIGVEAGSSEWPSTGASGPSRACSAWWSSQTLVGCKLIQVTAPVSSATASTPAVAGWPGRRPATLAPGHASRVAASTVAASKATAARSARPTGSGSPASGPTGRPTVRERTHRPMAARLTAWASRHTRRSVHTAAAAAAPSRAWAAASATKATPAAHHCARWLGAWAAWIRAAPSSVNATTARGTSRSMPAAQP